MKTKNKVKWWVGGIILFLFLFLGKIVHNQINSNTHKDHFTKKCLDSGGITVQLGKGKGWPSYICLKSTSVIPMGDLESSLVIQYKSTD